MSAFKHIQQFETRDPDKLGRQLSEFEDTLDRAITNAQAACLPVPADRVFVATQANPITPFAPDEQLTVDTSIWGATAVLPALSPVNFGRRFVLIKALAVQTVTVLCRDPAVTCNGTTFPAPTAVGVTVFYCNKYGYYT